MQTVKHPADEMTPWERKKAIDDGRDFDRYPAVPFMSEFKCYLSGVSIWDFWHLPEKMAEAEICVFNRYGYDRIVTGPNTRGITEALGGTFIYPEKGVPYAGEPFLQSFEQLNVMEPVDAFKSERIRTFARAAELLVEKAGEIVPIEPVSAGRLRSRLT